MSIGVLAPCPASCVSAISGDGSSGCPSRSPRISRPIPADGGRSGLCRGAGAAPDRRMMCIAGASR
jgi:hypothetical protein